MRLAITGATGLLGQGLADFVIQKRPDWELLLLSRKAPQRDPLKKLWKTLDISDYESTYKTVTKFNPDLVIHAAAQRSPDVCEMNPDEAHRVNFLGTRNVALACERFDSELAFISSDQVFYGCDQSRDHSEYDGPKASNVYGTTKILAEKFIQNHLRRFYIARTGKLFGGPGDINKSFMSEFLSSVALGKKIKAARDWFAHITYVNDFADALFKLIERKTYGIYHLVSSNVVSYWEVASWMAKRLPKAATLIEEVSFEDLKLPAPRAKRCALSTKLWELDFGERFPTWQESLTRFLKEYPVPF